MTTPGGKILKFNDFKGILRLLARAQHPGIPIVSTGYKRIKSGYDASRLTIRRFSIAIHCITVESENEIGDTIAVSRVLILSDHLVSFPSPASPIPPR